jgi:D-amino peptidase
MGNTLSRRAFAKIFGGGATVWTLGCGCASPGPAHRLKVYVFADMEGISGVTNSEQTLPSGPRYSEGCRRMAGDINACVAGCFDAGAAEVVVRDGHGSGRNVDPQLIDPRAKLIQGATPDVRFKDFDGAAALILLGYHPMSLTPKGLLAHTYSSATIQRLWLNGREVGEVGVDAAIAAEWGVPVVMVSGCDLLTAEARSWIPGVVTCQVKKSTGVQSTECLPLNDAHRLIRKKTAEAVRRRGKIRSITVAHPVALRWDFLPKGSLRTYDPAFEPVAEPVVSSGRNFGGTGVF